MTPASMLLAQFLRQSHEQGGVHGQQDFVGFTTRAF